jgi:hypothetical protein
VAVLLLAVLVAVVAAQPIYHNLAAQPIYQNVALRVAPVDHAVSVRETREAGPASLLFGVCCFI